MKKFVIIDLLLISKKKKKLSILVKSCFIKFDINFVLKKIWIINLRCPQKNN